MKNVLCPVNFTDTALNALEYACNIARTQQAFLSLCHVITDQEYEEMLEKEKDEGLSPFWKKEKKALEDKMENMCREIKSTYPDLECDYHLGYGSLTSAIIELAIAHKSGMIVMGNDGVKDITESLNGSSTVKVIERAPCPVLCVPFTAEFQGLKRVVYGTDFSEADREALHQCQLFLQAFGSIIDVVHIYQPEGEKRKEAVKKEMEELKSYFNYSRFHFHTKEYKGSVRLGLDEYMLESRAEMLILLTHQRNFLERVFQKSTSKRISYFADYPMLVFLQENLNEK